jgi:hypothetical protein
VCDVIFGSQEMLDLSSDRLSKFYQDIYNSGLREMDSSNLELSLLHFLNPIRSGTYINWGAGTSKTSILAKQQGYNLINYDPGIPDSSGYLSKGQLPKVDGIISNNVLDHLQNPIGDMLFMKSLLKENGSMIHASDGFEYNIHYTKGHLFFFVGKSVDFISKAIEMKYTFVPFHSPGTKITKWIF